MAISIKLDKEYKLHFGVMELDKIEEYHKQSLSEIFSKEKLGLRVIVTCLWAGISRFQPEFSPLSKRDDVLSLVDSWQAEGGDIIEITKAITQAIQESGLLGKQKGSQA